MANDFSSRSIDSSSLLAANSARRITKFKLAKQLVTVTSYALTKQQPSIVALKTAISPLVKFCLEYELIEC
jgi:hypothetical protein